MAVASVLSLLLLAVAVSCSFAQDMGVVPAVDDGLSSPIPIGIGFPFGDTIQARIFVGTNGYFVFSESFFGEPFPTCCPSPFTNFSQPDYIVAPFWADANPRLGGNVTYVVSQGSPGSDETLEEFSSIVQFEGGLNDFNGTWMLLATWDEVPEFAGNPNVTNTFSGAVITDGEQSFAIFFYECGDLNWGDNALIGFKASGLTFQSHSFSSVNATEIACSGSSNLTVLLYKLTPSQENYDVSAPIPIEIGFPFGDVVHYEAQVGTNGFITFGSNDFTGCCPDGLFSETSEPNFIVAPFWADSDFGYGGSPDIEVYRDDGNLSNVLEQVSSVVRFTEGVSFDGRWMIVVTWSRQFLDGTLLTNSFTAAVITDGVSQSYALFVYGCGNINWGDSAIIGYKAQGPRFENSRFSGESATDVDCLGLSIQTYRLTPAEPGPGVLMVNFTRSLNSFFESEREVEVCLDITGTIVDGFNYSVPLFIDPISSDIYGNDVESNETLLRIHENGTQCYTLDIAADDAILEYSNMEGFVLTLGPISPSVSPGGPTPTGGPIPGSTASPFSDSFAVYYAIDDEIVGLNFTQPAYTIREGDGVQRVCVRLRAPNDTPIQRPVTFRTHANNGNAIGGEDFSAGALYPRIGYFNIGAKNGDTWCLPVRIIDDSIAEEDEVFSVDLVVSDVQVILLQRSVDVTIIDDDDIPTDPLEVYFTGDTPRIVGNSIILQVGTNRPANVICRLNSNIEQNCPPGSEITIASITSRRYTIRAIATTAGQESARTEGYAVEVPQNSFSCSAHFINRGFTVDGNSATVEFGGAGDNDGFVCQLDTQRPQTCTSPLVLDLRQLVSGRHRLRITPQCSDSNTFVYRFDI